MCKLISLALLLLCVAAPMCAAEYWYTDDFALDEQGTERDTTTASTGPGGMHVMDTTTATATATATASAIASAHPNDLIASVLLDHAELRAAVACFREPSVCRQPRAVTGEKIVAALIRHDRREQRTLYPMAVFVEPEQTIKMKNEHVQVLSQLIDIVHADMNDTHVQNTLNNIINEVMKHVSEEERSFLPPMSLFLSKHKKLNVALKDKWQSITKTDLPTVVEMVENDHLMMKVMQKAFQNSDDESLKRKIAQVAIAQKNIHIKCEQQVIYPLVEQKFGERVADKLKASHDKIAAISLKNVPSRKFDQAATKMMSAMIKHVTMEEKYFSGLHTYLTIHPTTCCNTLKAYCACVLNE